MSEAACKGVEAIMRAERWRRWQDGGREGIEAYNEHLEKNGSALARFRRF